MPGIATSQPMDSRSMVRAQAVDIEPVVDHDLAADHQRGQAEVGGGHVEHRRPGDSRCASAAMPYSAAKHIARATIARWLITAPLGRPVVPLV